MPANTEVTFDPTTTTADFASMTETLELTAGDTHVPIRARLYEPDGTPADLEDARVTFRMTDHSGNVVVETQATAEDPDDNDDEQGWVRYEWSRGETDEPGVYKLRFHVRYPNREELYYPNTEPVKLLLNTP